MIDIYIDYAFYELSLRPRFDTYVVPC